MAGTRNRAEREALVEAAASAVAEQYAEIIPVPSFGMVFEGYFTGGAGASEFAPLYEVFRTREEIDQQSGNALIDPRINVGSECERSSPCRGGFSRGRIALAAPGLLKR